MDKDDFIVIAIIVALIALMFTALYAAGSKRQKLMEDCMQDGHKEYECVAMLKSNESYPIVVPMVVR